MNGIWENGFRCGVEGLWGQDVGGCDVWRGEGGSLKKEPHWKIQ